MGEVYRATDTNLSRQVAIKVLPETFAQNPERLARFEREARTLASLNHSNIATIHGLEKAGDIRALVMELVEGPTLAERIVTGRIPIDEALQIARQIAAALEAAYAQGVVHRDLKPANIKLRSDGAVKVLDFGLAKVAADDFDGARSQMSTLAGGVTRDGQIVGTAAYMSPEQARGLPVDKRTDIWAFGCVLFEMLTGRAVFSGGSTTDTLAAVLQHEPDWNGLPDRHRRRFASSCDAACRRIRPGASTTSRMRASRSRRRWPRLSGSARRCERGSGRYRGLWARSSSLESAPQSSCSGRSRRTR